MTASVMSHKHVSVRDDRELVERSNHVHEHRKAFDGLRRNGCMANYLWDTRLVDS